MIYSAALSPYVKKAYGKQCNQTNIKKIAELCILEPEVSTIDAVVIGPKDLIGFSGKSIVNQLVRKHEDLIVVYIYDSEKEEKILPDGVNVFKFMNKKVSAEFVKEKVDTVLSNKEIKVVKSVSIVSNDLKVPEKVTNEETQEIQVTRPKEVEVEEYSAPTQLILDEPEEEPFAYEPEEVEAVQVLVKEDFDQSNSIEARIKRLTNFNDFDYFKQALEKDKVIREVVNENTQYAGVVNMMDVLDRQINNIFKDKSITHEDKMNRIRELGVKRSSFKATANSILAAKFESIMVAIVETANSVVDDRVESIKRGLDVVSSYQHAFKKQDILSALVTERLELQIQLQEMIVSLIETYKTMDSSITGFIESLDKDLPTSNVFINEIMEPARPLFIPQNAAAIASRLMSGLQHNRISLSALETKIEAVVKLIFKLCDADSTLIDHQQKLIQLLMSQRVEDVVIPETLLKNSLRAYVGASNVGVTATALTWSGILARRQNTILIDLRTDSKVEDYGVEALELNEFMNSRIEQPFLVLKGNLNGDVEYIAEIARTLTERLNYYHHINIIVDSSQVELLNRIEKYLLCVHFITDSTPRSMQICKNIISDFKCENVAKKVVVIDPAIDALDLIQEVDADPLTSKVIVLPYMKEMRVSTLRHIKPYENSDIVTVFEEAFR